MLFNSYMFLFIFLPVVLAGYWLCVNRGNGQCAKLWLVFMSLWFYGSFHPVYLLVLLGSLLFNWAITRLMEKGRRRRSVLAAGIAGNLGVLIYFKYMDFFIENINALFRSDLTLLQVFLPLGISFFTFQQISFLVDNYRREIREYGFTDYILYITYFPKLLEGPLVLHEELFPQFKSLGKKRFSGERFMQGLCLFVLGMGKKVILADTFGAAVDYGYANLELMHSLDALLLILFYSLQLYFDFSGYCNMARGISRMLGIELPVNFNSPYKAQNIIDFWKRWHITLNRFFMKYLYIPLGGNRKGQGRTYRNLLLIFFISGLWHGAGWNFVVWGMLHGILYVLTRMFRQAREMKTGKRPLPLKRNMFFVLLTFCYVSAAWVYFRADSIAQANELFRIAGAHEFVRVNRSLAGCFNLDEFWYIIKVLHLDAWEFGHYILMGAITACSLAAVFWGRNAQQLAERIKPKAVTAVLTAGLLFWCVLTFSNVSTFIYFNF